MELLQHRRLCNFPSEREDKEQAHNPEQQHTKKEFVCFCVHVEPSTYFTIGSGCVCVYIKPGTYYFTIGTVCVLRARYLLLYYERSCVYVCAFRARYLVFYYEKCVCVCLE